MKEKVGASRRGGSIDGIGMDGCVVKYPWYSLKCSVKRELYELELQLSSTIDLTHVFTHETSRNLRCKHISNIEITPKADWRSKVMTYDSLATIVT